MRYDLLVDKVVGTSGPAGRVDLSLPEVMAGLCNGSIQDFPALRPHQEHAWFALLVQLAAIAAEAAELPATAKLPTDANIWRQWLQRLTPEAPSAWALVEHDLLLPAFLQSPVHGEALRPYKGALSTPDELDILVLAKGHDLKPARAVHHRPEHWLFALVTVQTMEGFAGARNYGVSRMNGGFGNRPLFSFAPGTLWPERFQRDVGVLLESLESDDDWPSGIDFNLAGPALLWTLPWDLETSLSLRGLHPWFIEICRPLRLLPGTDGLICRKGTSKVARLDAKAYNGNVDDPWTPVDSKGKSLTLPGSGFTYKKVAELLLTGSGRLPVTASRKDGDAIILMAATVRGQGKTEGFHERQLSLPPGQLWHERSFQQRAGELASAHIQQVANVKIRALAPAIRALLDAGERGGGPSQDRRPQPWLDDFENDVDEVFFRHLWASMEDPSGSAVLAWETELHECAERQLERAISGAPVPVARRWKAIAAAQRIFYGSLRKQLPTHAAARRKASSLSEMS